MKIYSTALNKDLMPKEQVPYTKNLITDKYKAFVYNIENGYHKYYDQCDVLYSEPAWKHGYNKFFERSNQTGSTFQNYVESMCKFISQSNKPAIIICGKADSKLYKSYLNFTDIQEIILDIHNCKALALFYNFTPNKLYKSNTEILEDIAIKYNCVGDFSCGYGNTADEFYLRGKSFVMSDIIELCIAFINKQYENLY